VDKPVKSVSPFCHWTPNSVCFSANNRTNGKWTFLRPANGKQAEEKSTKLPFSGTVLTLMLKLVKFPNILIKFIKHVIHWPELTDYFAFLSISVCVSYLYIFSSPENGKRDFLCTRG
jgi:hypothetical protein